MNSSNPYPGRAGYPGRVGIQQRVLPAYRAPFFDALAQECQGGLSVFAGQAASEESIQSADQLSNARYFPAHNRHFGKVSSAAYLCWQPGLIGWLESWQPAVLILEANARYQSTRRAIDWMHARRRPVIGWGLGAPGSGENKGGLRFNLQLAGRRRFLQNFDSLIAYSNRGAKEYCELGFPAERVFVAPNAVAHRPEFSPVIRSRASSDPLTVLFVGRLQTRKRVTCCCMPVLLCRQACSLAWLSLVRVQRRKNCASSRLVCIRGPILRALCMQMHLRNISTRRTYLSFPVQAVWLCSRRWRTVCR